MRNAEFSEWLGKRRWRGALLKPGMIDGRARRIARIPRALEALMRSAIAPFLAEVRFTAS